jgi:hypothetical protein
VCARRYAHPSPLTVPSRARAPPSLPLSRSPSR